VNHVQALIDAIGLGAVYALIAVGIGLVFGVLRLINFAYGQLIMIAAYMLVFVGGWGDAAAILIAIAVTVFASLVMERVAFRPLRSASPATMLVATFAISYLLQNVALLRYSYTHKSVGDSVGTLAQLNRAGTIGSLHVRWISIVAIIVGLVCLGLLALLLNRTSIGLQMRAAAADFPTARLLGVRADRVIVTAVAISGVLAAIAAVILVVQTPTITPQTGLTDTLIVFVGVVVGGLDRLVSATLGGFAIGFVTSFAGFELATQGSQSDTALPFTSVIYLPSLVYALVIVVLLVRPAGLFARRGQAAVERV
jgi:branched-chain amino acid transport system permease protein